MRKTGRTNGRRRRLFDAWETCRCEERTAVRRSAQEGDVEGASREDLELAGELQPRRQEVGLVVVEEQLEAGRDHRAEEDRGPQGRQGCSEEVLNHFLSLCVATALLLPAGASATAAPVPGQILAGPGGFVSVGNY